MKTVRLIFVGGFLGGWTGDSNTSPNWSYAGNWDFGIPGSTSGTNNSP